MSTKDANIGLSNVILMQGELDGLIAQLSELATGTERFKQYDFVVDCTNFYGRMKESDLVLLNFVLSLYAKQNPSHPIISKPIAFTAFYCICLYYYRKNNIELLHNLLESYISKDAGGKFFSFEEFPLIWDLACRLCVIRQDFVKLLRCAQAGVTVMPDNVALKISYVDAICTWLYSIYCTNTDSYRDETILPSPIKSRLNSASTIELNKEQILIALDYTKKAILHNGNYAKYYYYLAQLIFYCRFFYENEAYSVDMRNEAWHKAFSDFSAGFNAIEITWKHIVDNANNNSYIINQIRSLIDKAIRLAKSEEEIAKYKQFIDFSDSVFALKPNALYADKHKVTRSRLFSECKDVVKCSVGEPYVIVSYSWSDYKSVFCDILELQSRGINVVFDDILSEMSNEDSSKWHEQYERLLKKAECVLCYLNTNYVLSESVMKELKMMRDNKKKVIPIDISGKGQISKLLAHAIKNGATISSENMNLITTVFSDEILVYPKSQIEDSVGHLPKIMDRFNAECSNLINSVDIDSGLERNLSNYQPYHPQEDAVLVDSVNNIFVVADGITRSEGYGENGLSVAKMVADFFCVNMRKNLLKWLKSEIKDVLHILKVAFSDTNRELVGFMDSDSEFKAELKSAKKRNGNGFFEPSGCVGLVAVMHNRRLYFGFVGDCSALLVRDRNKMSITHDQTHFAFKIANAERDRERLYREFVNSATNQNGYGVFNGDANAVNFFYTASIDLQSRDTIYLMSDGISDFVSNYLISDHQSAEEILNSHASLVGSGTMDDRALIKIEIK